MGYYITNNRKKVELFGERLDLRDKNLVELVLPENCTYCNCSNNYLTKLIINSGCKEIICITNRLTELILPESCIRVVCSFSNIKSLIIPKNCTYCDCTLNYIMEEIFILGNSENILFDIRFNNFNSNIKNLHDKDKKLVYKIFELPECKLRTMLLSEDEDTFNLGLEILKNNLKNEIQKN